MESKLPALVRDAEVPDDFCGSERDPTFSVAPRILSAREAKVFFVSGSNSAGMVSSKEASIQEALAKAAEYMRAGMGHIGILAPDGVPLTEKDIDLLMEIERKENVATISTTAEPPNAERQPLFTQKWFDAFRLRRQKA